jgi:TolB protein
VINAGDVVFDGATSSGHFEVFVMHADGSGLRQLTDDANYNSWWARPSPNGARVLFYRTPAGVPPANYDQAALWMMNADGSGARAVFPKGFNGWTFQAHAEWSPDGNTIVFTAATTQALIMLSAPDGSNVRVLGGGPAANVDPSFSADGRWIAYIGCPTWTCNPTTTEVFVMPTDGSAPRRQLTHDSLRDQDPQISPGGTTVVLLSETALPSSSAPFGDWQLRAVAFDGSNVRQITSGSALESAPRWSSDGSRIWTHRTAFDANVWDVTSMRPDGSDVRPIAMLNTQEFPAFR